MGSAELVKWREEVLCGSSSSSRPAQIIYGAELCLENTQSTLSCRLPRLRMHVSSVLIELLTNAGGHMEPGPVEIIINIINIVEWSVLFLSSQPGSQASADWDQSRSVGSALLCCLSSVTVIIITVTSSLDPTILTLNPTL